MQDSRAIVLGVLGAAPAILIALGLYGLTLTRPKLRPRRWWVWLPTFAAESAAVAVSMAFAGVGTGVLVGTSAIVFGAQLASAELCFRWFVADEASKQGRPPPLGPTRPS